AAPVAAYFRRCGTDQLFRSAQGHVPLCRFGAGPTGSLRVLCAAGGGADWRGTSQSASGQGDFRRRKAGAAGGCQRQRRQDRRAHRLRLLFRQRGQDQRDYSRRRPDHTRADRRCAQGGHQLWLLHSGIEKAARLGTAAIGGKPMTISTACLDGRLPTVAEALALVAPLLPTLTSGEQIPLHHATGRVLARDVIAPITMPPWGRAAMDGFAFRCGSGAPLKLVGMATAARAFEGSVQLGECVAISTGARMPEGCDTVAMREQCSREQDKVWLGALLKRGAHVRPRGEDYAEDDILLEAGTCLEAQMIALLASAGIGHVDVHRPLRVAILSI